MDVEDIKFVINYDYPNSSEDYVHRIGRTARSTNKGTAYTFFTPGNIKQARELIKVLQEANQAINPKLMQLVDHGRGGGGGGGRSRYRSIPTSNNPNMMYMDECNRRLRGKDGGRAGGGSSFRDRDRDRGDSSTFNGANRGTYGAMGAQPTQYPFNQGTYGAPGATYGTSGFGGQDFNANNYNTGANATNTVAGRSMPTTGQPLQQQQQQQQQQPTQPQQPQQFGAAAPRPNQGPQPLMAQQFAPPPPPTPGMNYMGQSGTYQYQPPPPPPPPPTRK